MSQEKQRHSPIQRILVALDASTSSLNALHTAVDLAAQFKAEVLGLFVEDVNLLRLAELPMAREISFYTPSARRLKPLEMELQLRIQAARIRRTLEKIAGQAGVAWSFRSTRGAVGAEVLSAGAEADLVVLGKIGRSLPGPQRSGSTVRTLLLHRRGMTLIMESRVPFGPTLPVAALYDGTPAAQKALETATYLAESHQAAMIVFIIADSIEQGRAYQQEAVRRLEPPHSPTAFRRLVRADLSELADRIRRETGGPVVIPCLEDWFAAEKLCGLIDDITNPVLLIR